MSDESDAKADADYDAFLKSKLDAVPMSGFEVEMPIGDYLFPFQAVLVIWALRRGKSAVFASTGLGKTRMQIEWARHVQAYTGKPSWAADGGDDADKRARMGGNVLVLAPQAVGAQTAIEARLLGIEVTLCREAKDVRPGINITNYERLHKFDATMFSGIVLDESSCIKHHESATLEMLMTAFHGTPYRLCATATPAPNDWTELGTHAEFLGVKTRLEMLAEYFCHDSGQTSTWRLKGHAKEIFWRWVASWGAMVRKPSDLGYSNDGYDLPPLNVRSHVLEADEKEAHEAGFLFVMPARTLTEQRSAKRASMPNRVKHAVSLIKNDPKEQWIVWCELNAEQDALEKYLGAEAVSIRGAHNADEKDELHKAWITGKKRILISKSSIFGWGLNWQHCARMIFVGVTHSYESFFQAVRRSWRFKQTRPVDVHVICSETERAVLESLQRKEGQAEKMGDELADAVKDALVSSIGGLIHETNDYNPQQPMRIPAWLTAGI